MNLHTWTLGAAKNKVKGAGDFLLLALLCEIVTGIELRPFPHKKGKEWTPEGARDYKQLEKKKKKKKKTECPEQLSTKAQNLARLICEGLSQ